VLADEPNNTGAAHCLCNILKLLVADAVAVEPVSTTKFPANREKSREFFVFRRAARLRWLTSPMISMTSSQIPYATE
jgi:hypothetical protein